ncbi:MAG TPA: hypothetical protein VF351_07895 [Actinomycetota bacterium]
MKSGTLVALAAVTAVAVVAGGLRIVAPLGDAKEPAGIGSPRTRTSTVSGVTISYPDDWPLAMLGSDTSIGEGSVADGEVIVGHDVLFLSNTEPAVGSSDFFPLDCSMPPEGTVALLLRDFGAAPAALGLEHRPWPATPRDGYPERSDDVAFCLPATPIRSASWLASGRLFEAIIVGQPGPALDRLLEAYRTMTFGEAPSWNPSTAPDGSVIATPRWVLESGEMPGQHWNLLAYATRYPLAPTRVCLGLDINGIAADQMCDLDLAMEEDGASTAFETRVIRTRADGNLTTYVYGGISPTDGVITSEMTEESTVPIEPVRVSTMPASFDVAFAAGISVSPGRPEGMIRIVDPRTGSFGASPVFGPDAIVSLTEPDTGTPGARTVATGVTGGTAWSLDYEEGRQLALVGDGDDMLFDRIAPNHMASLSRSNPMLIGAHDFGSGAQPRYLLYGVTHHDVDELAIVFLGGEVITFERGALHNPSLHIFGRFPNTSPAVWWEEMPPGPVVAEIVAFDTACDVIARIGLALQPSSADSVTTQATCAGGG